MKMVGGIWIASVLLVTSSCAPPASPVVQPSPEAGMPQETVPSAAPSSTSMAAESPVPQVQTGPVTSGSGVLLELPRVSVGADCLRLNVALSGFFPPEDAAPDYTPPPPIANAVFSVNNAALEVRPRGGGGGGGQAPDGSFKFGQEIVYEIGGPLPAGDSLMVQVDLFIDPSLGFDAPVRFAVQASPDASPHCGMQGAEGP